MRRLRADFAGDMAGDSALASAASGAPDARALPRAWLAGMCSRAVKRLIDLAIASILILVLAPVMLAVAIVVRLTGRGPVIYRQTRVGRYERPFTMYKFRTMYAGSSDQLHREFVRQLLSQENPRAGGPTGLYKLEDDPRITPVGRWLRRTSLDELPQLFNVVLGQMSLVGPRPALPWEAELFNRRQRARFWVRPGITGLWQVSGRNSLTMPQGIELDLDYIRRQSVWLDLAILCRTILVVLMARDTR